MYLFPDGEVLPIIVKQIDLTKTKNKFYIFECVGASNEKLSRIVHIMSNANLNIRGIVVNTQVYPLAFKNRQLCALCGKKYKERKGGRVRD